MPVLEIRKHYLLSEALDLIGKRLFARSWTGQEYAQQPTPSPEDIAAMREPFETSCANLTQELTEIESRIARSLDQQMLTQASQRKREIEDQLGTLRTKLFLELPEPNSVMRDQWESYRRRVTTERTLMDAIRERRFDVDDGRKKQIHPLVWTDDPRFRCYIELSIAVTAKRSGAPRVQPVRIDEVSFDSWLQALPPRVAHEPTAEDDLSPQEKCRVLIRNWVVESNGLQLKPKAAYLADVRKCIENLSERAFEQAWAAEAPPSWKKHGKRKWPESPRGDDT